MRRGGTGGTERAEGRVTERAEREAEDGTARIALWRGGRTQHRKLYGLGPAALHKNGWTAGGGQRHAPALAVPAAGACGWVDGTLKLRPLASYEGRTGGQSCSSAVLGMQLAAPCTKRPLDCRCCSLWYDSSPYIIQHEAAGPPSRPSRVISRQGRSTATRYTSPPLDERWTPPCRPHSQVHSRRPYYVGSPAGRPVTFVCIQQTKASSTQDGSGRALFSTRWGSSRRCNIQDSHQLKARRQEAVLLLQAPPWARPARKTASSRAPMAQSSCCAAANLNTTAFPTSRFRPPAGRCFPSSSNTRGHSGTSRAPVHVLDPLFNSLILRTSACPTRASRHSVHCSLTCRGDVANQTSRKPALEAEAQACRHPGALQLLVSAAFQMLSTGSRPAGGRSANQSALNCSGRRPPRRVSGPGAKTTI
ncbi:uncharacterized protein BDZ99DRAFT_563020 [Mytilinidion resinicola]|uniref:Uncharacterized protein n=1 Tax=Mytilinidion resinicola TaxID=574789 RepID=A0A6A6YQP1_9PEZI|nr:uncharacterized protein BDZ99DRAFT_563020 [Mytilinidion resinicola]KAF2810197.1 hypothetical protein BDZ99DRAFT_563020 [Mytilinidion resinicola]